MIRDWTFEKFFKSAFIYNILWEDTEVDERYLGVGPDSTLLCISAAGCGVANHVARQPRSIDAVDINPHHLALAALKTSAAQRLESHDELYSLFGHGRHPRPEPVIRSLTADLPRWIRRYWEKHHGRFARGKSMVQSGLTADMLRFFRTITGLNARWLRERLAEPVEQRQQALDDCVRPVFEKPVVKAVIESPLNLIALGVNYEQRDRILETEKTDLVGFVVDHLKRVAATDLERNWFAWYAIAGHYNHDVPDAVPPYIRQDHHQLSRRAGTTVRYSNENIFSALGKAGRNTWSHYTLCDAIDWMPEHVQKRLFAEVLRTSRDGARVLFRSVQDESLVERHGLQRHFILDEEASARACEEDRSRQYRRVDFYTVAH